MCCSTIAAMFYEFVLHILRVYGVHALTKSLGLFAISGECCRFTYTDALDTLGDAFKEATQLMLKYVCC